MCDETNPLHCKMHTLEFTLGVTRELTSMLHNFASILSQSTYQNIEEALNNMVEVALLESARIKKLHENEAP